MYGFAYTTTTRSAHSLPLSSLQNEVKAQISTNVKSNFLGHTALTAAPIASEKVPSISPYGTSPLSCIYGTKKECFDQLENQ